MNINVTFTDGMKQLFLNVKKVGLEFKRKTAIYPNEDNYIVDIRLRIDETSLSFVRSFVIEET